MRFINKYNWEGLNYQKKMIEKKLKKIMQSLLLMRYVLKRRKNIFCLHFKTQLHNYSIDDPR